MVGFLKTTNLFCDFDEDEIDRLIKSPDCVIRNYASSTVLHFQNEVCNHLEIIISGQVQVQSIDVNGNMLVICDFYSGESFGENLLFSEHNAYLMTMIAKTDTKILQIHENMVLELCKRSESFLKTFLQSVSNKTLLLAGKIRTLSMKTVRQYVSEFLLREYYIQNDKCIILTMTKKELAERFGIQRPSLSRELNRMRADGLIDFDPKSITIKSIDAIKAELV